MKKALALIAMLGFLGLSHVFSATGCLTHLQNNELLTSSENNVEKTYEEDEQIFFEEENVEGIFLFKVCH